MTVEPGRPPWAHHGRCLSFVLVLNLYHCVGFVLVCNGNAIAACSRSL